MQFTNSSLGGCYVIHNPPFKDERGTFIKSFQGSTFGRYYSNFEPAEIYYSYSHKNVIRGMHFQKPPHDHAKLVTCLTGSVIDVVLDLRHQSPTYGQIDSFHLQGGDGRSVFIPEGFAHGFCTLEDNTLMSYAVSTEHDPNCDSGVHWKSINMTWPIDKPIVSERDSKLESLTSIETPF